MTYYRKKNNSFKSLSALQTLGDIFRSYFNSEVVQDITLRALIFIALNSKTLDIQRSVFNRDVGQSKKY